MTKRTAVLLLASPMLLLGIARPSASQSAQAAPGAAAPGAARRTYEVRATDQPITVDGRLDEAAWSGPPTMTLDFEYDPADNIPAAARTEIWITHDRDRLYAAIRAADPDPRRIRARLSDRDTANADDWAGLVLDTFADQRRAFEFFVNPLGVQMDMTLNEVTGNEDASWDAIWSSAGRITADGWEAEMAIPFSSLRFPPQSGPQHWGIDALRFYPREQPHRFGLHALPRGRNCTLCYEDTLTGFAGVTPGRNFELDPTVTSHASDTRHDLTAPFVRDSKVDPGITARWGVTPGMTLGATINPDFSQVEADAAQLSVNNVFALFYPEKRPFFLEGADLFDTKINAVYTRDIVDPAWGVKFTGKEGKNAIGAIVTHDDTTQFLLPGSQGSSLALLDQGNDSAVLRYRRDLQGTNAAVGGLFTAREGDGYHNRVAGFDTLLGFGEHTMLRIEALGSHTLDPRPLAGGVARPEARGGHALRGAWHYTTRDWTLHADYNDVSPDFRADLGFIPMADYRKLYALAEHYLYGDRGVASGAARRWYNVWTWGSETTWTYDSHGHPLQNQVAPYLKFAGPRQSDLSLFFAYGPSWFRGLRFDRTFFGGFGEVQSLPNLYTSLDYRVGQEIDYANARQGNQISLVPTLRFTPGRHLRLQVSDAFKTMRSGGGRLFTAHLAELRATYQFNVRTFVRIVTQYSHITADPALYTFPIAKLDEHLFNQLLFSYKLNPQSVLFAGYSDGYRDDQALQLRQASRTVFLKLGYAFVR